MSFCYTPAFEHVFEFCYLSMSVLFHCPSATIHRVVVIQLESEMLVELLVGGLSSTIKLLNKCGQKLLDFDFNFLQWNY